MDTITIIQALTIPDMNLTIAQTSVWLTDAIKSIDRAMSSKHNRK
jgi:hypothetical protein